MIYYRPQSLEIPVDDDDLLGRECPRCRARFKIDPERYDDRGFMNLRCPYCRFISELDNFTTGEQRQYMFATTHNLARRIMEDIVEEAFGGFTGSSRGSVEISMNSENINFGRVPVDSPAFSARIYQVECDECGFSFGIEEGLDGVCPVCR